MNLFLRKIVIFSIAPILSLVLLYGVQSLIQRRISNFKLDPDITTIFIGDSHIRYAINDKIIKNSVNLAHDTESFYFSYFKLKKYLSANPQINRVFLGYNFHSLTDCNDLFINGQHSVIIAPLYFFLFPLSEQFKSIIWNRHNLISYAKTVIQSVSKNYYGYSNDNEHVSATQTTIYKRIDFNFYDEGKVRDLSSLVISSLGKIANLCKEEGVELILLSTPLHAYYRENVPHDYISKYNQVIDLYNLKVLDLRDFDLTDDCYMPEGDHLSKKGAELISVEVAKYESLRNK